MSLLHYLHLWLCQGYTHTYTGMYLHLCVYGQTCTFSKETIDSRCSFFADAYRHAKSSETACSGTRKIEDRSDYVCQLL